MPDRATAIKYAVALMRRIGMGAHVKNTERSRNDLRPQASERAPMRGAERKARIP